MNRRQFLSRAALALGGAVLAPLVGAARRADAADDDDMDAFVDDFLRAQANYAAHPPVWVKTFDPADIERAFAEPVETWDFPSGDEEGGFDTAYAPLVMPTTTGDGVTAWGDAVHFPYIESLTARPGGVVVNDSHFLLPDGGTVPSLGPLRARIREVGDA